MAEPDRGGEDADIVIASSPLQYMNAVEQRASAGRPADLVLIGDRHAAAGSTIEALLARKGSWRRVVRHPRRPRPPRLAPRLVKDALDAAHRASLERLARRLGSGRRRQVVFGDYRNVSQRVLVDRLAFDEAVLLDDGSVTPQAAAWRADPLRAPEPGQFDLGWFRTALARSVFGERPPSEPPSVTFFTIYGPILSGRLAPQDRLAPHGYEAWRSGAGTARSRGEVWLLGADHAQAGICSQEDYKRLVLGAVEALRLEGRGPIVYRPHRGESAAKARALAEAGGMRLVRTGAPVELDYLDAAERPASVVVVASSAADTLAALDPELEIGRIALPSGYLRRRAEHISAVIAAHDAFNPRLRVITPAVASDS
ncbi:hypothetical protein IHQ68_07860 [Chelatococcus sambhunathii]|uniref:Uncharacterized protein n=1 Tax=Chelatococcus sambhunathii TaxID=363953 RepID=A0ABU1DF43_9HYPH|nr:hypothetical protein [Chelatococcus sambhunathii]MDR4306530.1 hypothetical protein [Chelatococcus sambhunathii]